MKYVINILLIAVLLLGLLSFSEAQRRGRSVTPYGDFCRQCTKYGTCRVSMSHDEAQKAMTDYYGEKGLNVEVEHKRGRFIKAKVKDRDRVVDVIIFDRKTGRVRSTY